MSKGSSHVIVRRKRNIAAATGRAGAADIARDVARSAARFVWKDFLLFLRELLLLPHIIGLWRDMAATTREVRAAVNSSVDEEAPPLTAARKKEFLRVAVAQLIVALVLIALGVALVAYGLASRTHWASYLWSGMLMIVVGFVLSITKRWQATCVLVGRPMALRESLRKSLLAFSKEGREG